MECTRCKRPGHGIKNCNMPPGVTFVVNNMKPKTVKTLKQSSIMQHLMVRVMLRSLPTRNAAIAIQPVTLQRPSRTFRPSSSQSHFDSSCPSGNLINEPFSFEEISALTFELKNSLQNVQHMPRPDAMIAFMNLYKND